MESKFTLRIYLTDGFHVTSFFDEVAEAMIRAIGDNRRPTQLVARSPMTGQPLQGKYFEITKDLAVQKSASETQYFHAGQIGLAMTIEPVQPPHDTLTPLL